MSGKSEFICKICKNVEKAGFLGGKKYKCPNHGFICKNCVDENIIRASRCKECDSKVMTYKWNSSKNKWLNS